eukprot:m.19015 g.19015  ORF g.19015 m.19015 type:complete len:148 (+) comp3714_c0_seq1:3-446(+)
MFPSELHQSPTRERSCSQARAPSFCSEPGNRPTFEQVVDELHNCETDNFQYRSEGDYESEDSCYHESDLASSGNHHAHSSFSSSSLASSQRLWAREISSKSASCCSRELQELSQELSEGMQRLRASSVSRSQRPSVPPQAPRHEAPF